MPLVRLVALTLVAGCSVHIGSSSDPDPVPTTSCGAEVKFLGAQGSWVRLQFSNVSDERIQIGDSPGAAFVAKDGTVLDAEMSADDDEWFMSFALPEHSHREVRIRLHGGNAANLDRIEVPRSGGGRIPRCTIKASGLSS